LFWSESYENKPHTHDDEYIDAYDPAPPGAGLIMRIMHYCVVAGLLGLLIFYTTTIVKEFHEDQENPPTVTTWDGIGSGINGKIGDLQYPAVLICPSLANTPLTLNNCYQDRYSSKAKKYDTWECNDRPWDKSDKVWVPYPMLDDEGDVGVNYTCWLINGKQDDEDKDLLYAEYPGAQNDLWMELTMNWADVGNQTMNWVGLYVFFMDAGSDPAAEGIEISDVFNSACIVAGGVVNVLSVSKNIQIGWGQPPTTIYQFSINSAPWGAGTFAEGSSYDPLSEYVISLSYDQLAVQTLTQTHAYKLQNVLGDFAGMFGALLGLDCGKIFLLLCLFPKFCMAVYRKITGQASPELPK